MADYPLPKFHFQVDWGTGEANFGFTEVSGLDFETTPIEYRHGASKEYNKTKQPGLTKYTDVTLKRGTFQKNDEFFKLWKETYFFQEGNSTGSKYRRTVTISLLGEDHKPLIVWKLKNAWPTKIQSDSLKADDNNVAIETMVLVHEGLTLEHV